MTVRATADDPDGDVTFQSTSEVNIRGNDQALVASVLVLPACTHAFVDPAGRVQTVTRSPGTAVPDTVWVARQPDRWGPVAVGGKVGRIDTEPVTAGA